jgi:ankyrin repeat protein
VTAEPPSTAGNVNQAMGVGERPVPSVPTPNDHFLLAAQRGDRQGVEHWLGVGADVNATNNVGSSATILSVREGVDVSFLDFLLKLGAPLDAPDASGRTPLSWAAGRGDRDAVNHLLDRGAATTTKDRLGRTPLHYAVFGGDVEVAERLIDTRADIDQRDGMGATSLMYACSKNDAKMVHMLTNRGADRTIEDNLGRTAAQRAHGEHNPCIEGASPGDK